MSLLRSLLPIGLQNYKEDAPLGLTVGKSHAYFSGSGDLGPVAQAFCTATGCGWSPTQRSSSRFSINDWPMLVPEAASIGHIGVARVLGAAAFSPDGRLLAVVRDQYTVQLFDLDRFRSLGVLTPPDEQAMQALEFSPDGGRLAAGCLSGRVRLWDLSRTRQQLSEFGLDWDLPVFQLASATNSPVQRVLIAR